MSKQIIEIARMDYAVIHLQLRHAEKLARWASIGRTIDWATRLLEDHADVDQDGETVDCLEELYDLKLALDDVGNACKAWDRE